MKDNFVIMIESFHIGDDGNQHNVSAIEPRRVLISSLLTWLPSREQVHELPPDKLKIREVVHIDIANDPISSADYKEDEDPIKFKSQKTGRGPLVGKEWMHNVQPVMTCYKLVTCEFKWFGLQTRVESFIQKAERRLFTNFHRQVFCWIDRWHGLTMEDIRAIEDNTKEELDRVSNIFFLSFFRSALFERGVLAG